MPRVAHFEIHANDPQRAIAFYQKCFGWQFQSWPGPTPYWLITTGPDSEPGINGGLLQRPGNQIGRDANAFVCTITVTDIAAAEQCVTANGATIALPRQAIPGVGWQFYATDPEGNLFGVHQADPKAA